MVGVEGGVGVGRDISDHDVDPGEGPRVVGVGWTSRGTRMGVGIRG